MPDLLILSATQMEVQGFLALFPGISQGQPRPGLTLFRSEHWHCLVTGPGVFNTVSGLAAYLAHHSPGLVLDTGIAGAFDGTGLKIGSLAVADQEQYAHTGVGQAGALPFDLIPGLAPTRQGIYPMDRELAVTYHGILRAGEKASVVQGPFLTVSTITDSPEHAENLRCQHPFVAEAMEGAAAAHVCAQYQRDFVEIRAISNFVGQRDKALWDIPLAVQGVTRICRTVADPGKTGSGKPGPGQ